MHKSICAERQGTAGEGKQFIHAIFSALAMLLFPLGTLSAQESGFQESGFRLKLSGLLANKLPPDTQLDFYTPFSDLPEGLTVGIDELPILLPFAEFEGQHWHVMFSSKAVRYSFSVTLSKDLFDKPRVIDVKLDAPRPHIRPLFDLRDIRYSAGITQRMEYRDLPFWDNELKTLGQARTPTMKIIALQGGNVIHNQPMGEVCAASRWFAFINPDVELTDGETYRMSVTYDSGGLFPTSATQCDFTYHSALHGD